jgi:hypothetical protein
MVNKKAEHFRAHLRDICMPRGCENGDEVTIAKESLIFSETWYCAVVERDMQRGEERYLK